MAPADKHDDPRASPLFAHVLGTVRRAGRFSRRVRPVFTVEVRHSRDGAGDGRLPAIIWTTMLLNKMPSDSSMCAHDRDRSGGDGTLPPSENERFEGRWTRLRRGVDREVGNDRGFESNELGAASGFAEVDRELGSRKGRAR